MARGVVPGIALPVRPVSGLLVPPKSLEKEKKSVLPTEVELMLPEGSAKAS